MRPDRWECCFFLLALSISTTTTTAATTSALQDLATQRADEIATLQAAIFRGAGGTGSAASYNLNDNDLHDLVRQQEQLLETYKSAYAQEFRATTSRSICKSFYYSNDSQKWGERTKVSPLPNPLRFLREYTTLRRASLHGSSLTKRFVFRHPKGRNVHQERHHSFMLSPHPAVDDLRQRLLNFIV